MNSTLNATILAAGLLCGAVPHAGAAAANDYFTNRTTLSGAYATGSSTTTGATVETGELIHAGSKGPYHSVWWSWTAPYSGPVEVNTQGSLIDTVLAVYTNRTAGANWVSDLALVGNNDDSAAGVLWSRVGFQAAAGVSYQMAVDGVSKTGTGGVGVTLRMGPSVEVVSPSSGFVFTAPAHIPILVAAAAATGSVARVEFYQGSTRLGQSTTAPYTFSWDGAGEGDYVLKALAVDSGGVTNVSAVVPVRVGSSVPPGVVWLSPASNSVFTAPGPVALSAAVQGSQTPQEMRFYGSEALLGSVAASPYAMGWSNMTAGVYDLRAVAVFAGGLSVTSAPAPVRIESAQVRITSPAPGQSCAGPLDLALTAEAGGAVAWVEFYADGASAGRSLERPYGLVWAQAPLGAHVIQAVAAGVSGIRSTSAPVSIVVVPNQPPAVSITSPVEGAQLLEPLSVLLHASATDPDNALARVEFFVLGMKVGESLAGPYTVAWNEPPTASYTLTAVATDVLGLSRTSAPVRVKIVRVLDSLWTAVNDQEQGPGSSARATFFTVPALGVSSGRLKNIQTGATAGPTLTLTNNSGVTATGTMAAPAPGTPAYRLFNGFVDWSTSGSANNGYQIYPANTVGCLFSGLDTKKVYRFSGTSVRGGTSAVSGNEYSNRWTRVELTGAAGYVPAHSGGVITTNQYLGALNGSQAAFNAGANHTSASGDVVQWDRIVPGPGGVFTVLCTHYRGPIPNGNAVNSLYTFGFSAMRLEEFAVGTTLVRLTSPAEGALVGMPSPVEFGVFVSGFDQPVSRVDFYAGADWVGSAKTSPYTFSWQGAGMGDYQLTAVATDDSGLSVTSAPVRITVQDSQPPTVAAFNPAPGLVTNLTRVTVVFSEPVTGVLAEDLILGGAPATTVTGSGTTYTFTFPLSPAGPLALAWSTDQQIMDLEPAPKRFLGTQAWETGQYTNADTVAPYAASVYPSPGARVRSLERVAVWFSEPVEGVAAGDLLVNGEPAQQVSGQGEGPYEFVVRQPETGLVRLSWAAGRQIRDLAVPANPLVDGAWTYTLNPSAVGHVVHISLDGMGAAYLQNYVTNAPEVYPNFVRLKTQGAWTLNARCDYTYSITLPNHTSIFTGRPVDQPAGWDNTTYHGLHTDSDAAGRTVHAADVSNPNVPYKMSVFDVAHDNGLSTAFLYSKASLMIFVRSWDASHGQANTNGSGKIDHDFSTAGSSSYGPTAPVVDEMIARLQAGTLWNYTFMHFDDPDATGHASGWGSSAWSNAIITVDQQLGRVMDALASSPTYASQTLLLVTADHGGGGASATGHGEPGYYTNYAVPMFLWGPGIPANVDLHTLFSNRADPGMGRPDYNANPQPLRNGDTGNIALSLLGLPQIPGSSMAPVFAQSGPVSLAVERSGGAVVVSWPAAAGSYQLQVRSSLGSGSSWSPVSAGITSLGERMIYVVTPSAAQPALFFRLKKQ